MKITKIEIENFRLLKEFSLDLEDELSLVIGKNNSGKTSILSILDKFLNSNRFSFEDFNLDFKEKLKKIIELEEMKEEDYNDQKISLKLYIEYKEDDNLANISKLMMDLDPENNKIELLFDYSLSFLEFNNLKKNYENFKEQEKSKKRGLENYLKENYDKYFRIGKKTIDPSNKDNFIDIEKVSLKDIINYQYIKANRDVSNKENDKSLSGLSSAIYENIEADDIHQSKIDSFKNALHEMDKSLDDVYGNIFESSLEKVKKFGGLKLDDTEVLITSTLQHKDLLKGNTTVLYKHNNDYLPEHYNGLGYMNLISMIFEIEILVNKFKRSVNENPADLNLLFIEEPEAHTHPQMQYIFIKNIKTLLRDEEELNGKLQYIITTHSSHIVSESDFEDIKYLKREKDNNSISANNLKDLEKEYESCGEIQNYKFLKQYLTLHRAELFFADKAIFIEGDTERILLPAMMKKIDQENPDNPLLSQNISIIETGAYSHIFEKFINFIGIKSLIITDIDSAKKVPKLNKDGSVQKNDNGSDKMTTKKDSIENSKITTNASLKFFYGSENIEDFKNKDIAEMLLSKNLDTKKWEKTKDGNLVCVCQTKEKNSDKVEYHARSFEDSFFHLNKALILQTKKIDKNTEELATEETEVDSSKEIFVFSSLINKYLKKFKDNTIDVFDFSEKAVDKKPPLAIEILLNSETDEYGKEFNNWQTPDYINQGLLWLKD